MKKLLILGLITLGLTSCGPEVGTSVYVGVTGGPVSLGHVVAKTGGEVLVVKLCDGTLYKINYQYLIATEDTCPNE